MNWASHGGRTSLLRYSLLTVFLFGPTLEVAAQTPGMFMPTGSMTTPRVLHTATPLADGTVLIAGGRRVVRSAGPTVVFVTYSSAERYDPNTGTFQATGSMGTSRAYHSATLLPDGRVLIAGGVEVTYLETTHSTTDAIRSSAELYDPAGGRFIPTGEMTTARYGHHCDAANRRQGV